jgi:hypothetical protein
VPTATRNLALPALPAKWAITPTTPKITPIAARPRLLGVVGVIARFAGRRGRAAGILIAVRPRLTGEVSLLGVILGVVGVMLSVMLDIRRAF